MSTSRQARMSRATPPPAPPRWHFPTPLHGWRAFIGEVGIVFLGVLIALAAQQMIDRRDWAGKRRQVHENLVTEMRDDNGVVASAIISRTQCADQTLDRMVAAMDRGADRREIAEIAQTYPLLTAILDNQAFTVAQSSEALLHGGAEDLVQWGGAYSYVTALNQLLPREWDAVGILQSWSERPGPPSSPEVQAALEAIGSARMANSVSRKGAASLLTVLKQRFDLVPARHDQLNLYRKYREQYGDCAIDAGKVDLASLRSSQTRLVNRHAR